MSSPAALELIGIEKSFGSIHANRGISIKFAAGSIHGLIGENGAGKSTLMSIVFGMQQPDVGAIRIDGRTVDFPTPKAAITAGIGMVHQHFMLIDRCTVLENLLLGTENNFALGKALAYGRKRMAELAREYGLALPPDTRVRDLSIGERQSVEILKALYRDARILILDEPTSVLNAEQKERLFAILRTLRDAGKTVIFVSHKLSEIIALTDHVAVLRQGRMVGETATAETDEAALATIMIGGHVDLGRIGGAAEPGEILLEANGIAVCNPQGERKIDNLDLTLRRGEIVAIAGLAGSGQSELLQALAGILPIDRGRMSWRGQAMDLRNWRAKSLRALGIAHVPDEPRRFGLVADFSAAESAILGYHDCKPAARHGLLNPRAILADCNAAMNDFDVRPRRPDIRTGAMSGGNQQKLLLAREMRRDPELLLIGEPTQGVDIGAVAAIQARLADMRARGKGVLLVTSDLDQIRALADRILVMNSGAIVGELSPDQATDRELGLMMGGVTTKSRAQISG
ncbi:MAG: heme transporter ATP-binding protein [Rhodospirillales bacterium]|nr:heme transporter ATP-binding protein [Rhodospirillales bacterium]